MSNLRSLPPVAALALLLAGPASAAEEPPHLLPTRDVDITYDVSRPLQPKIRQRVRWLAGDHLERVDGPDKSTTIFDRNAHEITLLTPTGRAYRKLEGTPRRPLEPAAWRGAQARQRVGRCRTACIDWSWTEDDETHTVCATVDGVLLRLVVGGQTVVEARSVSYGRQGAGAFSSTAGLCAGARPGRRRDALR